jgi:replicative DNA helicase
MDLDTLLGGFHRSDLVICAARPSVGKSPLLLNFARNAPSGRTLRVAVFTIEMSGEQLAAPAGVGVRASTPRLQLGQMSEIEERRAMNATGELSGSRSTSTTHQSSRSGNCRRNCAG